MWGRIHNKMYQIETTEDYQSFKRIKGNRKINKAHVNKLTTAFAEDPQVIEYNPIVVNENMEVIDGQHRLEAIKKLKLPVYYKKVPGLDLRSVQNLNSNSKVWSPTDYAVAYSEYGIKDYDAYLKHKRKYKFNHETTIAYVGVGNANTAFGFKRGKFKAGDPNDTSYYTQLLLDLEDYIPHWKARTTSIAFLKIAKHVNYDHDRMMTKIKKAGPTMEYKSQLLDAMRQFEVVFNNGLREDNQIRLY